MCICRNKRPTKDKRACKYAADSYRPCSKLCRKVQRHDGAGDGAVPGDSDGHLKKNCCHHCHHCCYEYYYDHHCYYYYLYE